MDKQDLIVGFIRSEKLKNKFPKCGNYETKERSSKLWQYCSNKPRDALERARMCLKQKCELVLEQGQRI